MESTESQKASPDLHMAVNPTMFLFLLVHVVTWGSGVSQLPNHDHFGSRDNWRCQEDHAEQYRSFLRLFSTIDFVQLASSHLWFVSPFPPRSPVPFIITRLDAKKWSVWFRALALHVITDSVLSLGRNKKHIHAERLGVGLRRVNKKTPLLGNWRGLFGSLIRNRCDCGRCIFAVAALKITGTISTTARRLKSAHITGWTG